MLHLPVELTQNITRLYTDAGRDWLNHLPYLLGDIAQQWRLTIKDCYQDANYNYVAPALLENGSAAVVKCTFEKSSFMREVLALQHFNGVGSVKILQFDLDKQILLLEKVEPGVLLEAQMDIEHNAVLAVALMKKLHKPLKQAENFQTLQNLFLGFNDLYQHFHGKAGPFPAALIANAKAVSDEMLASMGESVLLHGDLHYANILLSREKEALAIDPKGVMGEREFEIPFPRLGPDLDKKSFQYHLDCFIEISGFDKQRIKAWFFAKTALAAWWSFEDSGEIWQPFLDCAQILWELKI